MPTAVAQLAPFLSDGYRRELDQDENIWRSLPFFAATLALQVSGLGQLVGRLDELVTWERPLGFWLLTTVGLFSAVALWLTALAVAPASYRYIASEPDLLRFATELDDDAASSTRRDGPDAGGALALLLARQSAEATAHNRQVNQVRSRTRSIAGLCTLMSVLATILLIGLLIGRHILPKQ